MKAKFWLSDEEREAAKFIAKAGGCSAVDCDNCPLYNMAIGECGYDSDQGIARYILENEASDEEEKKDKPNQALVDKV